ncbi:hypothetical protein [Rhodopseudomonas sp. BR0M22]|uniref:hypothetical protein n=1 Tax=Rhodopseudomonas sp. BR0M22 TaxID=2269369 RepID=UPI0013E06F07|nr:hypothetical protein [Rhodopseudomonas sp. BR0M22]NEW92767.1 hypothetical protein [Rhodopseudomonas sp. BR0M22]
MTDKNIKYVPFATEIMSARRPHLSEPETEGEYADGRYKTEATATEGYAQRFMEQIQKISVSYFGDKKAVHLPWKNTKEGDIAFIFRSPKKKPELLDSKGVPLSKSVIIREGCLVRIAGVIAGWEKGAMSGVSLWLDAVRVIRLVEGFDASKLFGPPDEGFDVSIAYRFYGAHHF